MIIYAGCCASRAQGPFYLIFPWVVWVWSFNVNFSKTYLLFSLINIFFVLFKYKKNYLHFWCYIIRVTHAMVNFIANFLANYYLGVSFSIILQLKLKTTKLMWIPQSSAGQPRACWHFVEARMKLKVFCKLTAELAVEHSAYHIH